MNAKKLVKMANEIGSFFQAEPDRAAALDSTAGHIRRFWDPRMRREILRHLDATGGEGLTPFAVEAIRKNREKLAPPPAKSGTPAA